MEPAKETTDRRQQTGSVARPMDSNAIWLQGWQCGYVEGMLFILLIVLLVLLLSGGGYGYRRRRRI